MASTTFAAQKRIRHVSGTWEIVDVAGLPWPENPWKCGLAARFDSARASGMTDLDRQAIVQAVAEKREPEDLRACDYHRPDWHVVAAAACAVVDSGDVSSASIDGVVADRGLDECAAWALLTLFVEPISVSGDSLGNGQHRVCAMKLAGVPRCPIER